MYAQRLHTTMGERPVCAEASNLSPKEKGELYAQRPLTSLLR